MRGVSDRKRPQKIWSSRMDHGGARNLHNQANAALSDPILLWRGRKRERLGDALLTTKVLKVTRGKLTCMVRVQMEYREADPSSGPVVVRITTVLPCPAIPSDSLTCFHLPSFATNLLSEAVPQDELVTTTTPVGKLVTICTDSVTGDHLATFTRRPRSGLYRLHTKSAHVAASGQVASSCSLSVAHAPVSPLAPPSWSSLPVASASHALAPSCLWPSKDLPVLRLHSDHGGEFSFGLLEDLCHEEGIAQSFMLPASPQQNGIAECHIGLIMEVARTSMIHAAALHFLWPFAVQYAAHQLNLWPVNVEHYFLLVVDNFMRYTMQFPLKRRGDVRAVLIPTIRAVCRQLSARFHQDLSVLHLHSNHASEFSSRLLEDFCREEGITQSFTLPASPQQNGISERRIGLIMEVLLVALRAHPSLRGAPPPPLPPPMPLLLLLTSLVLRMSGLLLLVLSAAAARATVAGVVEVAAGVVVGSGGGGSGGSGGGSGGFGGGGSGGGSGGSGSGGSGGDRTGAQRGGSGGGQRQRQQRRSETPSPQHLHEWLFQRGASRGSVSCSSIIRMGDRAGQTCRKPHTQHRCFSRLYNAWRAKFGDDVERPHWAELLRSGVAIFDIDFDAFLFAVYALSVSAEAECYLCVQPDPGIEVAALGASESSLPGTARAEALHTFTLDSGASRCFFRESTTLTPLPAPVPVRLADPSEGLVLAHSSTVLPFCLQLRERFRTDLPVLGMHCERGGEFSSDLVRDFCRGEGILQSFTLPDSPQQNGIAERRIGLVMEVARTSMIHAAAPHFLWSFAVRYAADQLNLWPRVSLSETSPTLRWMGKVGDVSVFRVWGSHAFVRDTSADKLPARAIPCIFLGFSPDAPGWQFYHPTLRCVFPFQDIMFDELVRFYRLFPYRSTPPPPPPLFLAQGPPPVDPLPGTAPVEVAVGSGAARGAASRGAASRGAEPGDAESEGAGSGGAEPGGAELESVEPRGAEPEGVELGGADSEGAESGGAEPRGTASFGAAGAGDSAAGDTEAGGAGVTAGVGGTGGARAAGPGGARTRGTGAAGTGGVGESGVGDPMEPGAAVASGAGAVGAGAGGTGVGGAGDGGTGAVDPGGGGVGGTVRSRPYFVPHASAASALPAPSRYAEQTGGLTERREPASCHASPVRTGRSVPRPLPPPVPSTHAMALRPSSCPLRVHLPPSPESSLPVVSDPESDCARAASPTVSCLLATVVTDPSFDSTAASALVAALVDLAAACRLDYATALLARPDSASPPSVEGECALGMDVLEDRQEDLECLAAAVPRFASMLLAPEGDPNASDIPSPHSYAEAITGPHSSQWQAAMDAKMASWKSTSTYVNAFPLSRANIVDGMWIFRVKRSPGSLLAFKARYVARGFSQRQGVDYFHTFSPTPKMTTFWVLLHVFAQRDYELYSLDFSTTFLQGSLHEEIWLRLPPGFTESFPANTQWSLRRPVHGLRQAPSEWHDTLRTTLAALKFTPSTSDPLPFLRTDTSLPPFYVLITRDRARRTITLTRSHMVHHVLQCFGFQFSSPQPTPLSTGHSLSAPSLDESVEPSGPYPEVVGCLMYLMTCTRPDLAYPLSLLAHYVAPGRHRKVHWDAAKRVLRYLCSTSGMGLVLGGQGPVVLTGHADRLEHRTKHITLRYFLAREL
ncbi:unnamed protein product [Closterium sp. NIES-54]